MRSSGGRVGSLGQVVPEVTERDLKTIPNSESIPGSHVVVVVIAAIGKGRREKRNEGGRLHLFSARSEAQGRS